MKAYGMRKIVVIVTVLIALSISVLPGCFGGGSGEAKDSVNEAKITIVGAQQLLEDLLNLDNRINTLGTRFTNLEDTISEGKSLADLAIIDVDELESRYSRASELLTSVINMKGAGDYAEYARLALDAVDKELEALAANRELLTAVSDMLDVLMLAQNQEQLSYYSQEIERLTGEVSRLLEEGAAAAAIADRYYEEHGL
jgi:hypothetical protein